MGSQRCPVNSGVPQGSVFGPTLFLCYIDDLPDMLSCKVSIYADDTLLYQTVNCPEDAVVFQENINAVYKWARLWKMPFNDIKCLAINFGKVRPVVQYKPHVFISQLSWLWQLRLSLLSSSSVFIFFTLRVLILIQFFF